MAGSYDIQLRELKDTITQLTRTIQSLQKIIEEKESKEAVLQEQIDYLTKKLFGTSSEKRNAQIEGQLYLFNEAEQEEIPDEEDITEVRSHTRKAKKTNADKFASLPVREVVFLIPEDERLCEKCGQIMEEIGKEFVREELQFIPGRFERIRYYNITYRCGNCYENSGENTPFLKNIPPAPLMKHSPASPSSVAWVMYQKYANAMPLYRQEKEWKQQYQVEIKRATMANWIIYCSEHYLKPLYEYFHQEILKRRFLMADETRVQVLKEPDRRAQSDSYMWLYRTGEDGLPTILLYEYTETRARHNAEEFLKGFSGYLETDGYQGYENLPGIKRCCC